MVVGSYLITSTHIRIKNERGSRFIGLPNGPPPYQGRLTPSSVKERAELVFQLVPEKMKNLVIVNSTLSHFDMIQACVEAGDKYSDNVIVIPQLLALLTFALEDLSKFRNPPPNEVLLVVTITSKFIEFVILRRDQNSELYVAEFEHFEDLNQINEIFLRTYNFCYPHSTIILFHETLYHIADEIRQKFKPENCFIKPFDKWDYIVLYGGMLWALSDEDGYDVRYHIANFTHGYETTVQNRRTLTHDRQILLPPRSQLPCNIFGFNGNPMMIHVYYSPEYYQFGKELTSKKREASKDGVYVSGSSKEIIGYIDKRGIPYLKDSVGFKNLKLSKMVESVKLGNNDVIKSDTASNARILSQPSSSVSGRLLIKFLFDDNSFATEVVQNGITKILEDSNGNEWTPLYLSTVEGTVIIGEKAKTHHKAFPKHVIYDVMQIIGKPLNEVKINEKWGFELIDENRVVHFQVETLSDPRLISQEIVFAAFLKKMKLQTESNLDTEVKEISLSTNLKLNESQKDVFRKAAAKNNLEILSFELNNIK